MTKNVLAQPVPRRKRGRAAHVEGSGIAALHEARRRLLAGEYELACALFRVAESQQRSAIQMADR